MENVRDRFAGRVRPTVRFVEAFLGLGIILGMTVIGAYEVATGTATPLWLFGSVQVLVLAGTYPFVTGRWSTGWLGTYLLGFVLGGFGLGLAGTAVIFGIGQAAPVTDSLQVTAVVVLGHVAGGVAVVVDDVQLRRRPAGAVDPEGSTGRCSR